MSVGFKRLITSALEGEKVHLAAFKFWHK